jgi:cytochrome c-type biogenesis protein CcmE
VLIFALVTIVIYMVMYALEWSWNYVVLAPMIVDGKNQKSESNLRP